LVITGVAEVARVGQRDLGQATETVLGGLLEAAPDAILVCDNNGRVVMVNRQAEQLFGYRRSALLGTSIDSLLPHGAASASARRAARHTLEVIARRRDGSVFPAEITVSEVRTKQGALTMRVVHDVTRHRREESRHRFLTEAGAVLASSLDLQDTLQRVAAIAVPEMATWCVVDLVDADGAPKPVAVAHVDQPKEALVLKLRARYPFDSNARHGLSHVIRTGKPALYSRVRDEWREAAARDADHLALMRELNAQSTMCVPLVARDRVLGAITLVSTDQQRPYDRDDLRLVEELARRAALAIDNARLYGEAQAAREAAERTRAVVEDSNARLQAVQTVTDAALAHLPMDSLLRELMARLRDLLKVDIVAVLLLSEAGQEFAIQAALGLDEELEAGVRVRLNRRLASRLAMDQETLIVDDLASTEVYSPLLRRSGVRSLMGAPLLVEGRVLGVIHVGTLETRAFSSDDAHLLRLVGDRVALAINQSQLYEAEREARTRAERLAAEWHATLGQIADGVVIANPAGRIVFMNEAACELFGGGNERFKKVRDLPIRGTQTGDSGSTTTPLERALHHGETVRAAEVEIVRPDGTRIVAIGSAAPVIGEDGTHLGAVRTLHDVTAQRDLERQRDEFFTSASHDLRTPVATIKASVEVLLANEPPGILPVQHRLLANIDREADRMATLVNDLLELSRLRTAHPRLQLVPIDLRIVATRARDAIAPLVDARHQHLKLDLPTGRIDAFVDAARLERALVNLLANAQKYGHEGGLVRLALDECDREAVFSVVDDGPGIPVADRGRVFDRYYRAETEATRRRQGSGLGLPIARATAEAHGGRLWVEPTPGGGATFKLVVPLGRSSEDPDR